MSLKPLESLLNRRMLAVLATSFASGLPLALTSSTLQAWFTESGVDLMTIGLLTLVGLPYLFKVLWAPLMERFIPFHWGKRASWMLVWQFSMVVLLLWLAHLSPQLSATTMAVIALLIAFCSASQDVVIDAYRTDIALPEERGFAASLLSIGYRVAILISGALALILASRIGWKITYELMAVCMAGCAIVSCCIPKISCEFNRPQTIKAAIVEPVLDIVRRDQLLLLVTFIVLYKISDALALSLNTTFLLRGVGFELVTVGILSKSIGISATLMGGLVGGLLYPWLGLYRSLLIFGFLQISSNLLFAGLAVIGKSYTFLIIAIFGEYFCGGVATTAFVAFLMSLCHPKYTATQYALLSAIASIGRIVCGPVAAILVRSLGWAEFFVLTFLIGIPSLWICVVCHQRGGLSEQY